MSDRAGLLAGQTVIVTGGGSGIGRATARRAAREGASVGVLDRHAGNAEETVDLVRAAGGTAGA
jgi:NAD(P)-dependent dehydrogenase (short-subunit alcohol dehydrogenase family)